LHGTVSSVREVSPCGLDVLEIDGRILGERRAVEAAATRPAVSARTTAGHAPAPARE
jgi:hypothetical protein